MIDFEIRTQEEELNQFSKENRQYVREIIKENCNNDINDICGFTSPFIYMGIIL